MHEPGGATTHAYCMHVWVRELGCTLFSIIHDGVNFSHHDYSVDPRKLDEIDSKVDLYFCKYRRTGNFHGHDIFRGWGPSAIALFNFTLYTCQTIITICERLISEVFIKKIAKLRKSSTAKISSRMIQYIIAKELLC